MTGSLASTVITYHHQELNNMHVELATDLYAAVVNVLEISLLDVTYEQRLYVWKRMLANSYYAPNFPDNAIDMYDYGITLFTKEELLSC